MYSAFDFKENVKNGYMVKTKDKTTGFILTFFLGAFGLLYYGFDKFREALTFYGLILCFTFGAIVTQHGFMIFMASMGGICLALYPIYVVCHDEWHFKLTEKGVKAKEEYEKLLDEEEAKNKKYSEARKYLELEEKKIIQEKILARMDVENQQRDKLIEIVANKLENGEDIVSRRDSNFSKDHVFCTECGGHNNIRATYCSSCGKKLEKVA